MQLDLTALEWEILEHRLSAPDCLQDALEEDGYHPIDVEAVAGLLLAQQWQKATDVNERLTWLVLADCVNGSTFYAASDANGDSPRRLEAIARAGQRLARKIEVIRPDWIEALLVRFPIF